MTEANYGTYLSYAGFQCLEQLSHTSIDLYLSTCGMQNCLGGHSFGPGKRDEYILHFICEGKGVFKCNGNTYSLSKGDVFLVKPDTKVFYKADDNVPWSYVWVGFQGVKAETYLLYAGYEEDIVTGHYDDTTLIFTYVQQMLLSKQLTHANELKREAALLQILAALMEIRRNNLPKEDTYDYPYKIYVNQAVDYIQRNFKNNIRINDLAGYIGIDRSYLTNIFKNVMNVSPQEYLLKYRMEKAEMLLKNSDNKINTVAALVGYSDPLSFSKMFKKCKGVSPTEYRENLK